MALSCSFGSSVTMTLSSNAGYSDLDASWSSNTNLDSDLTLGILMVLGGNRSHICQSRPWLL